MPTMGFQDTPYEIAENLAATSPAALPAPRERGLDLNISGVTIAVAVWLIGVIAVLGYIITGYFNLWRVVKPPETGRNLTIN